MDDDEDPVELEVNVHLSKSLASNLYLLQYPVRPNYMTYDNVEVLSGKVKQNQKQLELEIALNTDSKHYSKSKGEQFALNVDGRNPDATSFYNSGVMDKQVLHSHPSGTNTGRYALGYYKNGELYLSPIHAQVQMKPSFNYLDKSDTRAESKLASQEAGDSSQDEAEEEAKAVTVKFARPESDIAKARRLASFGHHQKVQEEEQWVPLSFHNNYSEESERELMSLCQRKDEASNEFHMESSEYLKLLMAQADEVQQEKAAMPSNVLSLTQLKSMPLNDQVKALLTNAKVIQFSKLLHLLPHGTDQQAVLRALQIVAVMVQGCWVVKSEVLYPKDGCSPNSGISSELLCRGRDFVMWRFTMSRCVTRKEIASIIKLPSEDVKDILEQMSRIKVNHGWEFVCPHDYDFTDRYPEVVERQTMLWDAKFQTLSKQLNITEAQEKKIREIAATEAAAEKPRRRRTSSRTRKRTLSGRSVSDHSDMETEAFDIDQLLKDNKSKSEHNHNSVLNGATMEVSNDMDNIDNHSDEFRTELRAFIKEKLFSRYVLSMTEFKLLLNLKLAESPPGYILGGGVTEKLCEQAVIDIGGVVLNSKWQQEPFFMHIYTGDDSVPVRKAIYELAQNSNRVFKKAVIKNAEAHSGMTYSDNVIKDIIRAGDGSSLQSLEVLMSEFFNPGTSNDRKRQIEELLNQFSQTRDCWKQCLFFLSNTHNEYVMMYCLTVMENLINRQWMGFSASDKQEIRLLLNQYLLEQHAKVPAFIRNKLIKLVVDIGRIDWPHFYPDFFSSILQLVQQSHTTSLGIILLHTASEELAVPREDLSMSRKEELHKLLLTQVPTILGLLNTVLDTALERHRHLVSATPPPSPTHGESAEHKQQSVLLFTDSPLKSDSIMSDMFKSPGSHIQLEALPPLDSSTQELCALTLNCLSHFFSWIPLSSFITPALLSTIFHFAGFGCETQGGRTMNSSANFNSTSCHLGILAMDCINELLSKNCVPSEFEDYLLQMFQQTFYLLQKLTKDSSTCSSGNRLTELDDNYVDKFTEFLRLFVSIHLRRFESNSQFPVIEFLALLFKYTFRQPTNEGFYNCLDIWTTFLDYLLTRSKGRPGELQAIVDRYKEALMSLVRHILQKLQFKYNQTQLEELDDETLDYDEETEWQHFLRQCLELIARIAEILTAETFQILYEPFQEMMEIYFGLERHIHSTNAKRSLNIRGENDCRRLHCSLRDLSSLLQGLGRLADHFIAEKFSERFTDGQVLIERLIHMVVYGSRVKLFELTSTEQTVLQTDLIEVHAQALAAIKPFAHWLSQFYTESQRYPDQRQKFTDLITTLLDAITCLFYEQIPDKISHSAAHLLLSVVTTVRPNFLLQIPCVQKLYNSASQGAFRKVNIEVQVLLYRSLSLYLLLPWNNIPDLEQDWTSRASTHQTFCHQMAAPYFQLKDTTSLINNKAAQDAAKPLIGNSLKLMIDWIECVSGEVVKSKQICYQSMSEVVNISLAIFPVFIHQPDAVENLMTFFLALFQSCRVQMGVPFTDNAIQTFMGLFSKEQLAETISHESSAAHRVIEKFLKILQIIIQEPGTAFKRFIPSIIDICMDYIYPIIAQRPAPDMKQVLYEVLHELLLNNWRYFFKGSVLTKLSNQEETVEHEPQFIAILQSYGQSFLQTDIAVFRQNLESLEKLNTKWKLYKKPIFYKVMQSQFMIVLLQVLVHKSHDLLQEEIVVTVYNMASVDFDRFYSDFLPQFLSGCEGLDNNQKQMLGQNFKAEKDLPTFTQNLLRFVNDLRYYRLMNSSLPEGSVQFS